MVLEGTNFLASFESPDFAQASVQQAESGSFSSVSSHVIGLEPTSNALIGPCLNTPNFTPNAAEHLRVSVKLVKGILPVFEA